MFSARTGQARIGYRPSRKSIQRVVEKVHALTGRSRMAALGFLARVDARGQRRTHQAASRVSMPHAANARRISSIEAVLLVA